MHLRPTIGVCLLALLATACNQGARQEWSATDHEAAAPQGAQTNGVVAPGEEQATLIALTWRNNCARCHGMDGRGQVQEGRMLRVPDLTRPALGVVDDATLANTIRKGRNKMPAFDLPPKVVDGLIAHIRKLGG
jgi:cytochrome c oxidase cbb3-type subunit 3